jgi:hypothetical protein
MHRQPSKTQQERHSSFSTSLRIPHYVLLSDAPPLKEGGHGCSVLAWNWMDAVGSELKFVVTRRLNSGLSAKEIAADFNVPSVIYPDLSRLLIPARVNWIKSVAEVLLFALWMPYICSRVRASGADRVFAFFGGGTWFLFIAKWLAAWSKLPLDIYLVDDLEESARLARQTYVAKLARWLEPKVLGRADRVFTISLGYAEHLRAKYGIEAEWLPVAIRQEFITRRAYERQDPDVRRIAFIGAVNPLYLGALKDLLQLIEEWNAENQTFGISLLILTYTSMGYVKAELGDSKFLEVRFRPCRREFEQRLQSSWAIFMPYSFSPDVRLMVSTSFPTKLVDCFPAGRPIVVYGPPYGSVPRYFETNQLPLCANSLSGLKAVLRDVEGHDTLALMQSYQAVIQRLHSPSRLRAILGRGL